MSGKKWSLLTIFVSLGILILIGMSVIVFDPYFHYHAPLAHVAYRLDKEEYMNDGITKHFDYDAIITGTSMTKSFNTTEADKLFGVSSIRITYMGEGFKKINDNLKIAINSNPELKLVIRGIDPIWFVTGADWLGYDEYPNYLYDDKLWNDINYLLNKDVLFQDLIPVICRTISGDVPDHFDNYGFCDYDSAAGKDNVLKIYQRAPKVEKVIEQSETDSMFEIMESNLSKNVIDTIEENPDLTFYLFFPPYSICWWDSLNQNGAAVLNRRIDMEKFAIEQLLPYDNVRLFSFFNNYDLICNLDNYRDDIHYMENVNNDILKWMSNGDYELTQDNYLEYIEEIRTFYRNYDYDEIFE